MGVQIRIKLNEKHTVPQLVRLWVDLVPYPRPLRKINQNLIKMYKDCLSTKSGMIVID